MLGPREATPRLLVRYARHLFENEKTNRVPRSERFRSIVAAAIPSRVKPAVVSFSLVRPSFFFISSLPSPSRSVWRVLKVSTHRIDVDREMYVHSYQYELTSISVKFIFSLILIELEKDIENKLS